MKIEFPVKHIENNLVFSHDGTVWAYYKIDGFNYDFLEDDEKVLPFQQQMSFLTNVGLDLHYLVIPNPTNIKGILNSTIEEMVLKEYPLKENGIQFIEQVKKALENKRELNESSEYHHYIGIQLDPEKNRYISGNAGINALTSVKKFFEGFSSPLYQAVGLYPDDILESQIKAFQSQAVSIESTVANSFGSRIQKVTTEELVFIIEKTFSTRNNNTDVQLRNSYEIGTKR